MNHLFKTNELIYESPNSIICRGIRLKDQLPVVLKKLNRSDPSPIEFSRFRREFTIAARFNHPGIIQVYDIHEADGGSLFIAMEDCGGESVHRYFNHIKDLGLEEQLNIAYRITEYLEHIHSLKIIHMDINPANIVWCPDLDVIKIIDFGISTELSPEIEFVNPSALEGTLAYMSPEQTGRMNRPIDYRTDLYSLGVTFYELFTGRLPFIEDDPLALIHAHIAVAPTEASKINKKLPGAVSQIISKLMAKDADERYLSAAGVKNDIQYCTDRLAGSVESGSFKIASNDVSTYFRVPQKLYFREQESFELVKAFDDVCRWGECRLMLVAGHSGVGKTLFVGEIVKHAIQKKAFFISGKFGEMEQSMPHAIIIQAFNGLFNQLLSDTEERLNYWRRRINEAVYPNGRIITDVIPVAKHIIMDQPPLLQLEPKEAQNRFNQCFLSLIQILADAEHPLVLFLDDLQWADKSIFGLLDLLVFKKVKYLFLIGAYRSNEVTDAHPLNAFINAASLSDTDCSYLNLRPFELEHTKKIVSDAFGRDDSTVCELAEILYLKTQGNPFFLIQSLNLLYSSGAIHSDGSGNWKWEKSACEGLVDDVVDLMISKMRGLSRKAQSIIKTAACIDSQVSLNKLIIASGFDQDTIVPYLADLVAKGFLAASSAFKYISDANGPIKVHFRFLHDRIRQAAYRIDKDLDEYHLKIGLRFWKEFAKDNPGIAVFDVVKQCNRAPDQIPPEKRLALAGLNLKAGLKAKDSSAWDQSVHYFSSGIKLLKDHDWNSSYELAFDLHCGCAETALILTDFDMVGALCETILGKARSLLDKCFVWDIQIMALVAQGSPVAAVDVGLRALRKLGIKIKPNLHRILLVLSLFRTKLLIKEITNTLSSPQTMMSSKHLVISKLLMRISTAAYVSGSTAFVPIVLKSVWMFVKYGYSPHAIYAITALGGLLGVIGDHSSAHKFGQLALSYAGRADAKPNAARTVYITTAFTGIYNVPYKDLLPNLLEHYKIGVETGDLEYAAFNIYCYCYLRFISGDTLGSVNSLMSRYADNVKKQDIVANFFSLYQQLVQNLLGKANDPLVLSGEVCDENSIRLHMEEHRNDVGLFDFYTKKIMLGYLFYDFKLAIDASEKAMQYIQAAKTKHDVPIAVFYQALTICALLKSKSGLVKPIFWKILKRNIRRMKKWSKFSTSSFLHKYLLLNAEFFFIKGDNSRAEKYYHESLRLSEESGIRQEMAIASELLALYYKYRGYEDIYHHYIRLAFGCFRKWGAIAKCRALEDKFGDVFKVDTSRICYPANKKNTSDIIAPTFQGTTTQQTDIKNVDLLSVLKASQLISGEMDIDALSKKLLNIVLENAGAQKGALIFLREDSLEAKAIYCIDECGQVDFRDSPNSESVFPQSVVNYVARTKNYMVIGDALNCNSVYSNDPYIQSLGIRSILCLPLIRNDIVIAILYLDNRAVSNAFNENGIKVLELLSAQAAISIENAKLYTIQLEKKMAESKTAAISQFLAHMSHEIRTPLNTILGYAELIRESGYTPDKDYIKNIISSGELLLSLVDEVLDFSRIEKGIICLNSKPMSFKSIFAELEYQYKRRCSEKGLSLHIQLDEYLSRNMVESDEVRIRQVLLNLLNNALKYTEIGFIRLTAKATDVKSQSVDVICTVSDSGIGIEDTCIIFGDFEQLTNDQNSFGGFGIGLAVVKKLVEALGGHIAVESKVGEGSKFTIKFTDLKIASDNQDNEGNALNETIHFHRADLLVVDDNKSNLKLLKEYFADQLVTLYTADNGFRAQELIRSTDFAAILLDLKMPAFNGADFANFLKADRRYASVPVIIITADVTDESKRLMIAKKCDEYLLKPISKRTLFTTLKRYLSHDITSADGPAEKACAIPDLSIPANMENDMVQRISAELKTLKDGIWVNLKKTMIIGDICSFADDVHAVGKKYGFDSLMNWGTLLRLAASTFDVVKTELIFSHFPEIIGLLDSHAKSENSPLVGPARK